MTESEPGFRRNGSWYAFVLLAAAPLQVIAQAPAGNDVYVRSCAMCHGPELRGGEVGPALIGSTFQQKWSALPPDELDKYTRRTMPPTNPGGLSERDLRLRPAGNG